MAYDIDMADIDAQLQGRGGHHHGICTALEFFFHLEPGLARKTAVMRAHLVLVQALSQLVRNALD
jgi:hypothetical protein